jgi:hypothetical protein
MGKGFKMKQSKIHELKIMDDRLQAIIENRKTFEIRYNDRDYQVGDILLLRSPDRYFSISVQIIYIDDFEQKENYLVLGIKRV